ncbi:MAG: hypothetical protein V4492_07895 [Chlamydiota bacterium]
MSGPAAIGGAPNQITWNGQQINFRVFLGTKEVTNDRDWRLYAGLIYNQALGLNPAESAKKAEILINGNFASIDQAAPANNPFQGCSLQQVTVEDTVLADAGRLDKITTMLNTLGSHSADVFPRAAPMHTSTPPTPPHLDAHLTDVMGGGRCGPASIVHQMCIRAPSWHNPTPEQQLQRERHLRMAASQNMQQSQLLRNDPKFRLHIFEAFRELQNRGLLTDPAIAAIVAKHMSSHHTADTIHTFDHGEMQTLIDHYAVRVREDDFWIDFAFIYALKYPMSDITKHVFPIEFQNGIDIVVLQGNPLNVMHNTSNDILAPNNLYIWFNGRDHYKSVKHDSSELRPALETFRQRESLAEQQLEMIRQRNEITGNLRHFANSDMRIVSLEHRAIGVQGLIVLLQQLQALDGHAFQEYTRFLTTLNHSCGTAEQLIAWQAHHLPVIQTYLNLYLRAVYPAPPVPLVPGSPAPPPSGFDHMSIAQLLQIDSTHMNRDTKEELLNHLLSRLYLADPNNLIVYFHSLCTHLNVQTIINQDQRTLFNRQINNIHVIQGLIRTQLGI